MASAETCSARTAASSVSNHDRHKPASVREQATLTGRKEASLSRTLKRFAQLGIVAFQDGPHRARAPALIATRVHLEIDLTGHHSAVALDGSAAPWSTNR
jgi:predicted transcriptional regulator